ncbi:MAG: acetylglutamate kinase [Lentisphaerae bacterium]|jgi:acetylglutamate kinase|nr:acetylglutamate kinase [Lentisphaerota bacterium]
MQAYIDKAATLIEALPYIQSFRGAIVIVKVGGSVMENADNLDRLLSDIAFMSTVSMKVVLVHGGGKAISRGMEKRGIEPRFVQGLRVTDGPTMEVVESVLKNEVNADVVRRLRRYGANARPLHGDWIFAVTRRTGVDRETGAPIDWGFVGDVTSVDTQTVSMMLDAGVVPVVTPLGVDDDNQLHNINADTAAAALAKALRARKLAFISDVPGLLRDVNDPASLISSLPIGQIATLQREGVIGGGMLPKLDSCAEAIRVGVGKVHLIDGRMPHSLLLEIFTKKGVGTEIIADEQE